MPILTWAKNLGINHSCSMCVINVNSGLGRDIIFKN